MSKHIHHDFQWSHTENAIYMFHKILEKNIDNRSNLEELFFKTAVCATEKLDGTNVAKDESGQIYGRRMPISKDTKVYQKTSLEAVRSADIEKVKTVILKETKLEKNSIKKFLLYGELICNHFYDYDKRDLHGKWMVFGARIVGEDNEKIYKQLSEKDFYIKMRKDCVLILPNSTFLNIVKSYDMDVPNMIGEKKTIFEIVKENKYDMARGKIEGIIFTWYSAQNSGNIAKWKGPQEPQPRAIATTENAINLIENESIEGNLRVLFEHLKEVAEADSDINPHVKERLNFKKEKHAEVRINENEKKNLEKQVLNADKRLVVDGIHHSMRKFDDIETYKKTEDDLEKYITMLRNEVRRHYVEEKQIEDNLEDDNPILEFINDVVKKIAIKKANPQ